MMNEQERKNKRGIWDNKKDKEKEEWLKDKDTDKRGW